MQALRRGALATGARGQQMLEGFVQSELSSCSGAFVGYTGLWGAVHTP